MPEENGSNNKTGVLEKAKESAAALRKTLEEKSKQQLVELKEPEKTQLYRSIFRVKHDEEPRNRALSVLSNVFFHLHPAKVNLDPTGKIVVDTSKLFMDDPRAGVNQFNDTGAYLPV